MGRYALADVSQGGKEEFSIRDSFIMTGVYQYYFDIQLNISFLVIIYLRVETLYE